MWNGVEVARQVRIIDLGPSGFEVGHDLAERIVGLSRRPKSMGTVQEVSLEDWFQDEQDGHLYHPVSHARYSERASFAVRLRYMDTAHRLGFVATAPKGFLNLVQKCFYSAGPFLNRVKGHSVAARRSPVRPYSRPCRFECVSAVHAIIQGIKPESRFLLGLLAQLPPQQG